MNSESEGSFPAAIASGAVTLVSGVPAPIANGALKGVSQLVGSAFAIPQAWLDGVKERVEDRNYAGRQLRRGLADAALVAAKGDESLVERTLGRLLADAIPLQRNREAIAEKVLEEVIADADSAPEGEQRPPEDDWLKRYMNHAEHITNEDAQRIWAKVMAREIYKPGTIGPATLDALGRLSRRDADLFTEVAEISFGNILPLELVRDDNSMFKKFLSLSDTGLVRTDRGLGHGLRIEGVKNGMLVGRDFTLEIFGGPSLNPSFVLPCFHLSNAGYELTEVIRPRGERRAAEALTRQLSASGPDHIILHGLDPNGRFIDSTVLYSQSPTSVAP